jgi:hypothetical protein
VAPADVQVDGTIVFSNIANGEFAEADVPAGSLEVALLPTGGPDDADAILGPLDVTLEAQTLSMIYAYGNPRDQSMNVISHTMSLESDGAVAPTRIDTGSAGLVQSPVGSFGTSGSDAAGEGPWPGVLGAAGLVGALALVALARVRRRSMPPPPVR